MTNEEPTHLVFSKETGELLLSGNDPIALLNLFLAQYPETVEWCLCTVEEDALDALVADDIQD